MIIICDPVDPISHAKLTRYILYCIKQHEAINNESRIYFDKTRGDCGQTKEDGLGGFYEDLTRQISLF